MKFGGCPFRDTVDPELSREPIGRTAWLFGFAQSHLCVVSELNFEQRDCVNLE